RVVARRYGRPAANEDGPRAADARGEHLRLGAEQDEVLGRKRLDLGERAVGVGVELDEAADRVGAVLCLGREFQLGDPTLGIAAREDDDLGRAGRKVDRDLWG